MLRIIVSYSPELAKVLYTTAHKGTLRVFVCMITGLCLLEKKSTSTGIAKKLGIASHDSLTRLLYNSQISPGFIVMALINQAISLITALPMPCYLILDDVLIPKPYASSIEGAYYDYDHVNKRKVFCHRVVVLAWTNGIITIPVAFAFWHKKYSSYLKQNIAYFSKEEYETFKKNFPQSAAYLEKFTRERDNKIYIDLTYILSPLGQQELGKKAFNALMQHTPNKHKYRTKNQLARLLIYSLRKKGLPFDYITFDAWYASKENLNMLNRLGIIYYTALSSRRKIKLDKTSQTCKELGEKTKAKDCSHYEHKGHELRGRSFPVEISGVNHCVKLVLVKGNSFIKFLKFLYPEVYKKKKEKDPNKYLLTNNQSAATMDVVRAYASRWQIEIMFRDLKQHLGLCACQHRKFQAVKTYFAHCLFAYVHLQEYEKELETSQNKPISLEDAKKHLQAQSCIINKGNSQFLIPSEGLLTSQKPMEPELFDSIIEKEFPLVANT